MIYYFKKDNSTTKIQKKKKGKNIYAIYGESAGAESMCQKWFAKFCKKKKKNPPWTMLHSQVDHLKLTAIKLRHELRTINILQHRRWLT